MFSKCSSFSYGILKTNRFLCTNYKLCANEPLIQLPNVNKIRMPNLLQMDTKTQINHHQSTVRKSGATDDSNVKMSHTTDEDIH